MVANLSERLRLPEITTSYRQSSHMARLDRRLRKTGYGDYTLPSSDQLNSIRLEDTFSTRVATRHRHKDIQFKEMKAVLHAIQFWLIRLRRSILILYCDNDACIHGLQKSSIRGPDMAPLRVVAMLLAKNDILLTPI